MALGNILITCVPTPSGTVTTKYRDGDDSAANPPSTPVIGQPNVINSTTADIPLVTASTGGTAPRAYELSLSTTSAIAGFSVADANADFSGDGVCTVTGLAASTQYWARLATVDADGRRSGYSGTFTFTTAAAGGGDVTAPTAPSSLAATSTVAGRASLTWVNGTDAVGIAYTDVLRGNSVAGVPSNSGTVIDTVVGTGSSYTDVSAPAGSEVFYRVQHRDAAGNVSAQSARVFVTIASAGTDLIRFAPGHYFRPGYTETSTTISSIVTKLLTTYDSRIKGIALARYWKLIEPTKGSMYWNDLDAVFNACVTSGKKFMFRLQTRRFNSTNTASVCPQYLIDENLTYTAKSTGTASWRQAAMDYQIEVTKRVIDRYGDSSTFVGIFGEETAYGPTSTLPSDYSAQSLINQEIRYMQALRAYAPQLPYYALPNYLSGEGVTSAAMASYFAAVRSMIGVYVSGGPDLLLYDPPMCSAQQYITGAVGGVNHIGAYGSVTSVEFKDFNDAAAAGVTSATAAAALYNYGQNTFQANIMTWVDSAPGFADVYSYINGRPTRQTVPSTLVGLVTQL